MPLLLLWRGLQARRGRLQQAISCCTPGARLVRAVACKGNGGRAPAPPAAGQPCCDKPVRQCILHSTQPTCSGDALQRPHKAQKAGVAQAGERAGQGRGRGLGSKQQFEGHCCKNARSPCPAAMWRDPSRPQHGGAAGRTQGAVQRPANIIIGCPKHAAGARRRAGAAAGRLRRSIRQRSLRRHCEGALGQWRHRGGICATPSRREWEAGFSAAAACRRWLFELARSFASVLRPLAIQPPQKLLSSFPYPHRSAGSINPRTPRIPGGCGMLTPVPCWPSMWAAPPL